MFIIYCYIKSYGVVQSHFNKTWKDRQKQNKQSEGSVVYLGLPVDYPWGISSFICFCVCWHFSCIMDIMYFHN